MSTPPPIKPDDWIAIGHREDTGATIYVYVLKVFSLDRFEAATSDVINASKRNIIWKDSKWQFERPNPDGIKMHDSWTAFLKQGPPSRFDMLGERRVPKPSQMYF
jgi:hypothetical protein